MGNWYERGADKFAWSWLIIVCAVLIAARVVVGTTEESFSLAKPFAAVRGFAAKALNDGPRLTGIIIGSHASAVIGGEIVYEGSVIGDAKVIKIETDRIHFEKNGKRWIEEIF